MTGVEIKRAAENYVDEAIDDAEAVDAINAALSKIGDIAIIYDTVSITDDVGKQWMDLPATTTYVVEVLDSQGEPYDAWRVRDSMIQLKDPGTYTIHYRRLPEPIGGILDTPEVPCVSQLSGYLCYRMVGRRTTMNLLTVLGICSSLTLKSCVCSTHSGADKGLVKSW